jgi:L-ascorbate metabolism protein UlaG (beta-lactamase superfamily)
MRITLLKKMAALGSLWLISINALVQPLPERIADPAQWDLFLYHRGAPAGYLDREADYTLQTVQKLLEKYPPQLQESLERRLALFAVDGVLYDDICSPQRPAIQSFFHSRMRIAGQMIKESSVSTGVMIFKLYNHGFIVKTRSVTLGFDIIRGYCVGAAGFPVENQEMDGIINACDALFISHDHADHVDEWVVRQCIDKGVPVIAPPDLWPDNPIRDRLVLPERDLNTISDLPIKNGKAQLKVTVLPGHQGENVINNVYLVTTPEGIAVCHTGDQHNRDDLKWIGEIAHTYPVDVLMVNCWARDINDLIHGFSPQLVLTGHEHELGHGTDQRKPYWLTYARLKECDIPALVMTWGESLHFVPQRKQE